MGTEEDTFRRLRKPDYANMRNIWVTSDLYKEAITDTHLKRDDYLIKLEEFFNGYGWTVDEYSDIAKHGYE